MLHGARRLNHRLAAQKLLDTDEIPLSQSTVSQHLKVLKEAGVVRGTIDGPRSCYCVDSEAMDKLRASLADLFGSLEQCC